MSTDTSLLAQEGHCCGEAEGYSRKQLHSHMDITVTGSHLEIFAFLSASVLSFAPQAGAAHLTDKDGVGYDKVEVGTRNRVDS